MDACQTNLPILKLEFFNGVMRANKKGVAITQTPFSPHKLG